jgi:hypothetical protein
VNKHFFVTMLCKTLVLFIIFNVLYLAAQPLANTSLTLYNRLFPGRLRLAWRASADGYLVSETLLSRLIADHLISRPKAADEYRVVVLGSSETWGYHMLAQEAMPTLLDEMRLQAPDGRRVRVYNLAYVFADVFKDMLVLRAALDAGAQPDLIVLPVNIYTFAPLLGMHWLAEDNPELALELIEQYGIASVPREPLLERVNAAPYWWRHGFIEQRSDIAAWLTNQMYGFVWGALGEDNPLTGINPLPFMSGQPIEASVNRADVLDALAMLTQERNIPLVMVEMPANYIYPESYTTWLEERTAELGIMRLNCTSFFPSEAFDGTVHFLAEGHRLVAQRIAAWLADYWQNPALVTRCPVHTGD